MALICFLFDDSSAFVFFRASASLSLKGPSARVILASFPHFSAVKGSLSEKCSPRTVTSKSFMDRCYWTIFYSFGYCVDELDRNRRVCHYDFCHIFSHFENGWDAVTTETACCAFVWINPHFHRIKPPEGIEPPTFTLQVCCSAC